MNDDTTPDTPEDLGNTVDGSRVGDGDEPGANDGASHATSASSAASPEGQLAGGSASPSSGGQGVSHHDRDEQKKIYQTPEQPDRAVGGPDGTADGM